MGPVLHGNTRESKVGSPGREPGCFFGATNVAKGVDGVGLRV